MNNAEPGDERPGRHPGLQRLYDSTLSTPVIIVVAAAGHADPEVKEETEWATFGATYALMLGAWAKGIGTFFRTGQGVLGSPELRGLLKLPPDHRIIGAVYAGYPAATVPQKRRTPASEKTVWPP